MTVLKERFGNFGVDDDGDTVPLEDFNEWPVANESIVQGTANLKARHAEQGLVEDGERLLRADRERALMEAALRRAGVHNTLD